jgi:hypothetical protein
MTSFWGSTATIARSRIGLIPFENAHQKFQEGCPLRLRQGGQYPVVGCFQVRPQAIAQAATTPGQAQDASAPVDGTNAPMDQPLRLQLVDELARADRIYGKPSCEPSLVEVGLVTDSGYHRKL